jgi:hypothetical protein
MPMMREKSVQVHLADADSPVEIEIDFEGGFLLVGTVKKAGRPAASLVVSAILRGTEQGGATGTDVGGRFRLEGLDAGEYEVSVKNELGHVLGGRLLQLTRDEEIELEVPAGVLTGRIVRAGDQSPVANAEIALLSSGPPVTERKTTSSSDGRFRVSELPDGVYRVLAQTSDRERGQVDIELRNGLATEVTVHVERSELLVLNVRDVDGSIPQRVQGRYLNGGHTGRLYSSECDSQGRCEVEMMPLGQSVLVVYGSPGAAVIAANVPGPEVAVQLRPRGTLSIVAKASESSGAWKVRILDAATGMVIPQGQSLLGARGEWVLVAQGSLREALPEGRYVVEAVGPSGKSRRVDAVVKSGETASVHLEE